MTQLRQKMMDLMQVKKLSPRTQKSYLYSVKSLTAFYNRPPDKLSQEEVQLYFVDLIKHRHLAANSCRVQLQGIRFFYRYVIKQPLMVQDLCYPKRELRIPDLLTRKEVLQIVNSPIDCRNQTLLKVCYGCGLRVSELCHLCVRDIDSERQLLFVQGKGNKDRLVPLTSSVLVQLRHYWQRYRPSDVLFYTRNNLQQPIGISSVQRMYNGTKKELGIKKKGSVHGLRHAFATHQLEAGIPIHLLQKWLGHSNIRTTMQYVHWIPNKQSPLVDLLEPA